VPRLSVLMARAALVYLAAGFTLGALLLIHRGLPLGGWVHRLLPLHVEFVLLGWTVQFALGVAFWILPRFRTGPERGREWPAWLAFLLLNVGVLAVGVGGALGAPAAVPLVGRVAEALAGAAFGVHAWPRVKAFG